MRSEIARLLLLAGTALMLAGCDAGDKGNSAVPQASGMSGAANAATPSVNVIDRSHAGSSAPTVAFESRPGVKTNMAALKGQRVLVNLWATWCAPCIAEMPALDALASAQKGKVMVLPISQDMEGWPAVNGFFKPGKFKALQAALDQPGSFSEAIKARGLPMSVLYDDKGKEVWRVNGTLKWESAAVQAAL